LLKKIGERSQKNQPTFRRDGPAIIRELRGPMLTPGLVSITFRQLAPEEVIALCGRAGVRCIEWGGDVHVPPGEVARAREVGRLTRAAGLEVAAYGSYYRLGVNDAGSFEAVLASAAGLGAPTIRVWAGRKGARATEVDERCEVIADALRVADLAARSGITISLEYHADTLTDERESVRALLGELAHPNIEFLWQPTNGAPVDDCASRLIEVLPRLRNVHVFHWWPTAAERHPLVDGEAAWRTYIDIVRESGRDADFLLEFVRGDSPEQFLADAAMLNRWLAGLQ
jgi:sugar phosphate isomerase/epimerase